LPGWWKKFKDSSKYLGASLAIILVKRKLGRRPNDWTLWLTLGRLYEVGYQWPQAIAALKNARKLDPHNEIIARQLSQTKKAAKQESAAKR
jgi:cytochrome c-type biogenesis protein CcmH/NrfG